MSKQIICTELSNHPADHSKKYADSALGRPINVLNKKSDNILVFLNQEQIIVIVQTYRRIRS